MRCAYPPHHGGLEANTAEFAEWCRPRTVIVSSSRRVAERILRDVYRGTPRLYLTPRHGAITVEIQSTGKVSFDTSAGAP